MRSVSVFTVIICLFLASCGEDNTCTRADWAGTYVLQDKDCIDESVDFEDLVVIEEGMGENTIIIDGDEVTIIGCEVASAFGLFDLELDGEKLKIAFVTGGCEGNYKRN